MSPRATVKEVGVCSWEGKIFQRRFCTSAAPQLHPWGGPADGGSCKTPVHWGLALGQHYGRRVGMERGS